MRNVLIWEKQSRYFALIYMKEECSRKGALTLQKQNAAKK